MYSENLQFIVQRSRDNKIRFLDIEVIVKNDCIITNWYRKPTLSGGLLNFYSHKIYFVFEVINTSFHYDLVLISSN